MSNTDDTLEQGAEVPSFYQGEMQFKRYSDSSTQGQQLTFLVDSAALDRFKGEEGARFMCVLVKLDDGDQPVPLKDTSNSRAAGRLCNDINFCRWLYRSQAELWQQATNRNPDHSPYMLAGEVVRQVCGVRSRADLDSNPEAWATFMRLQAGYLAARRVSQGVAA